MFRDYSLRKVLSQIGLIIGLLLIFTIAAAGQSVEYPCEADPVIKQELKKLRSDEDAVLSYKQQREQELAALRSLLEKYPDNIFIHQQYQDRLRTIGDSYPEDLIKQYRDLVEKHQDDPVYLFLLGRLLFGYKTPEAIALLEKASKLSATFPQSRLGLFATYQSQVFGNKERSLANLRAYLSLCPSNLSAYSRVLQVEDKELLRSSIARMRIELDSQKSDAKFQYYNTLWQLEFKVRPAAAHAQLRKEIGAELKRMRALNLDTNKDWLEMLSSGYKLVSDYEGVLWTEDQMLTNFPKSLAASRIAYQRWSSEHPRPDENAPPEKKKEYADAYLKITSQWIRQWPSDSMIWNARFDAITANDALPIADVETAMDVLLDLQAKNEGSFASIPPVSVRISDFYLKRDIRLDQIPNLIGKSFQEVERNYANDDKTDSVPAESKRLFYNSVRFTYWDGWPVLAAAYLKMGQPGKVREILFQMEDYLSKHGPESTDSEALKSTKQRFQSIYWEWMGRLAEAENRKLDALTYYQNGLGFQLKQSGWQRFDFPVNMAEKSRQIWKELGGTDQSWQARTSGTQLVTPNTAESAGRTWEKPNKNLPAFELKDLEGKTWKLDDIKGKVAIINVWATWCGPCRMELPYIQKLHDRVKGRSDVMVLSLNMDTELGLVQPYMTENKFSFTVLPAHDYVEGILSPLALPQTWIVGPTGVIQLQQMGFGSGGDQWVEDALKQIQKIRGTE